MPRINVYIHMFHYVRSLTYFEQSPLTYKIDDEAYEEMTKKKNGKNKKNYVVESSLNIKRKAKCDGMKGIKVNE